MDLDIAQLARHPSRRGTAAPRPGAALIALVRRHGPLLPVLVRPVAPRRYEILGNTDVWLAAQACGHHRVPVEVVEDVDEAAALEILAVTEARPKPLDAARQYRALVEEERRVRSWGAATRVARRCGVPRTEVARALRVLELPEIVQEAVDIGALSVGHAYALLACRDSAARDELATLAIERRWSVRELERRARAGRDTVRAPTEAAPSSARSPDVVRLERRLSEHLGAPTTFDENGGTLTIDYRGSLDVLEGVLGRIGLVER